MYRIVLGWKNWLAPINKIDLHYILDVGTGTGIWALYIAQKYTSALVTAIDLAPIQSES
jgi:methylase of polypeptide subunit release factors